MVRKKALLPKQKEGGGVSHVDQAAVIGRTLVAREMRGPGDTEAAMRRIEARYGVPYALLWALRYRPPKDIFVGAWLRLTAAYEAECERQEQLLRAEIELTRARNAAVTRLVRAAVHMAGPENSGTKAPEE